MLTSSAMRVSLPALLSFNGGFVDTAGFLGLQGLFTAHVTGNFVTLAATLVMGTHGVLAKILALPEFAIVVALARLAGSVMRARRLPDLRMLLAAQVCFLLAFFVLAVVFGPFPDSDEPAALLTAFAGVAGMGVQNAIQLGYFARIPPTTFMTGNTTQAVLDAVDLLPGMEHVGTPTVRSRFARTLRGIIWFAAGCAAAAALSHWIGFWCLIVPVLVAMPTPILRLDEAAQSSAVLQPERSASWRPGSRGSGQIV
jgi:uncharacterized membrane protein YoaK (UPF0700 family)